MKRWGIAALLMGCGSADLDVRNVEVVGDMQPPSTIEGRDGGVSGMFAGRSVWVYGDSIATTAGTYPSTWRNNTMSWTTDTDAHDGVQGFVQPIDDAGAAREFFPRTSAEAAFNDAHFDGGGDCASPCGARYAIWGSGPVADPARSRALLTYARVYSEPGEFNFTVEANSIAVWTDFDAGPERPDADTESGYLFDSAREGEYGIPVVDDDMLYLFSCSGGHHDGGECTLARAPLERVLEHAAWRFKSDEGWSTKASAAEVLFEGSPNMTVHWNAYIGRFIATYVAWGELRMRTAKHLGGPWSDSTTVFETPEDNAMHGLAHPELDEDDGRVTYVSYLAERFKLLRIVLARP